MPKRISYFIPLNKVNEISFESIIHKFLNCIDQRQKNKDIENKEQDKVQ